MNKTPMEVKMDLLIGVVQDLKEEVKIIRGTQKPSRTWLSTRELADSVGVTDKCILKWVHKKLIPSDCYSKKKRGKYFIYRFHTHLAMPIAEKLRNQ